MIKLIVFDLDNVIMNGEAIDEIGKIANVEDQIAEITDKAMNGELDFETSIQERVKLLEGVSVEDIVELREKIPLTNGAEETVKSLKDNDYEVIIISGSFDIIADPLKEKLGVDGIFVNSLVEEDGVLTGEVSGDLVSGSKLDVLNNFIGGKDISLDECVAIGDGANDISIIEASGLGIAFNAKPAVKEIADVIVDDGDLTAILPVIEAKATEDDETEEEVVEEVSEDETVEAVDETVDDVVEESEEAEAEDAVDEEVSEDGEAEDVAEESEEVDDEIVEFDDGFVLADTIEGVKQQKVEKEEQIAKIAEEREHYNMVAKEQRKIRDELNDSLKENLNKAIEFRDQRNKINKEVEEEKKLRNKANKDLKNLEWSSGKKDKVKLENEIKKIDKIIETRVLDIKKENQLVKNANDLRKQLMDIHEDDKNKEQAQELRKESEDHHARVVELSEQAQEAHEQMLHYFRKTDEIRAAADEAHKSFVEARKAASSKHEEFKLVLSEIHVINKKLGTSRPRKRKSNSKQSAPKKNTEEKEKAESLFDKFKHGKKLSTEELLLLQKYDIN
ncbi:phosphoserine phosphatase SerB [Methanobrevibacter sp.]